MQYYGKEEASESKKEDSIEDKIAQELADIQDSRKANVFKTVPTTMDCGKLFHFLTVVVFITAPSSLDVSEFTRTILNDLKTNKSKRTR